MRVGHGYDVHKFKPDRKLVLGGVEIPFREGLYGHSDADVLTHAIMDSLLGAAGLGDIGRHFPDSEEEYRGISSIELLKRVKEKLLSEGYVPGNIDATVVAERPRLSGFVDKMRDNIARALDIPSGFVNIKATTEEGLGFTGEGKGMAAHSVCTIYGLYEGSTNVSGCGGCQNANL